MTDHLHAEFAKLWTSAQTPPDVVKFLGSLANPSPKQIGAIVKLDQQCRWKTAAPMTVQDYLSPTSPEATKSEPGGKLFAVFLR